LGHILFNLKRHRRLSLQFFGSLKGSNITVYTPLVYSFISYQKVRFFQFLESFYLRKSSSRLYGKILVQIFISKVDTQVYNEPKKLGKGIVPRDRVGRVFFQINDVGSLRAMSV
jgi:hypothetical protein